METQYTYGWEKDGLDHRDIYYKPSLWNRLITSNSVDLRTGFPMVWNQGQLGSCVSHGILACDEFVQKKEKLPEVFKGSKLYLYYNGRVIENTVNEDSGLQVRDGIKALNTKGICPETMWGYDISKFKEQPPPAAYTEGAKHPSVKYFKLQQGLSHLLACLDSGYPFVFGFNVYSYFESDEMNQTGLLTLPGANQSALGGHCVAAAGYSKDKQAILCRNSWGKDWSSAMGGYFWMPFSYITNVNLASDIWTLRTVK